MSNTTVKKWFCKKCMQLLDWTDENFYRRTNGELGYRCKGCVKLASRISKQNTRKLRARLKQRIADYKLNNGCADCGYNTDAIGLDFDHRPGEKKEFNIGNAALHVGWERVENEIAKCDVVCAICHRIRTYNRRKPKDKYRGLSLEPTIDKNKGATEHKCYVNWAAMISRCYDLKASRYKMYGGRGITVCERWFDFWNFLEDMGERPDGMTSIDRIDSGGNYEPGNCRWADPKMQARNTSDNRMITYQGETMCVAEAAERVGLDPNVVHSRLSKGWTIDDALHRPKAADNPRLIEWKGKMMNCSELARLHGMNPMNLIGRLNLGWDLERALTTPIRHQKPSRCSLVGLR